MDACQLPDSTIRFDEDSAVQARAWLLAVQEDTQRRSPASLLCKCFKPDATAQVLHWLASRCSAQS